MAPLVDDVAATHPDVEVDRVDASGDSTRARALGIKATPTLVGIVDGDETGRLTGRRGRDDIERLFVAVASRTGPPPASRTEGLLRAATGVLLALVGVLTGPSWPLVAVGAAIGGYGVGGLVLRRFR